MRVLFAGNKFAGLNGSDAATDRPVVEAIAANDCADWTKLEFTPNNANKFETRTYDIITDVKDFKSEIGILYLNDFNHKVLEKLFHEFNLEFHPILECSIYVYMWKGHPLADRDLITLEDLREYPCLSFEQGTYNSFYFAEEVLSTYEYKRLIKANDRATLLNLMVGLNGYTLCSGIICEELNGSDYCAVKLDSDEVMTIGYLARKGTTISKLGQKYLEEIAKYKDKALR